MGFWTKRDKDKASYLDEYNQLSGRVELLTHFPGNAIVPSTWRDCLSVTGQARLSRVLDQWNAVAAGTMCNTIAYLSEYLQDIEVMRVESTFSILYTLANRRGGMSYFSAGNPINLAKRSTVPWSRVPLSLQAFYSFQDGFWEYTSGAGLSTADQVRSLANLYGGSIDRPDVAVDFPIEETYLWFSNAGGGYVATNLESSNDDRVLIWWIADQPIFDVDFWPVVDEWTVLLFDN